MAIFDLIYTERNGVREMSCGVLGNGVDKLIGPFPAKEAGPKIVDALFAERCLMFPTRKDAEAAYIIAHFRNMSRGANDAGQDYPFVC